MTYEYSQYLAHHGVKGQKWGVRRYQNEDGSLTIEGKSRYGRGKEYEKERREIFNKEYDKLKKSSKPYKDSIERSKYLSEKYGVDSKDEQEKRQQFKGKEFETAENEYWKHQTNIEYLDAKFNEKAHKSSYDAIKKRYGDAAVKDIQHYKNVNAAVAFLTSVAGLGIGIAANRHFRRKKYGI